MIISITLVPGRNSGRSKHDWQAVATDTSGDSVASYSGLTREQALDWLKVSAWGPLSRITADKRWSCNLEYTGDPDPKFVVRFIGERMGQADTAAEAATLLRELQMARVWELRGWQA